jgi:hypothetical protein
VSSELQSFLRFYEEQKARQASHFPTVKAEKVLTFMGTTSLAGSRAAVSVNALRHIDPGPTPRELRLALGGALPRPPARGECITVHVTRLEQYQGYQVKTRALGPGVAESDLLEPAEGGLVVKGAQTYTVHHSPYTLKFFESVPYDELTGIVGGVKYALVAVGETANLSPRFIFHHAQEGDRLALYHGDGLALKTYMNLKSNGLETRLVLDLDDFSGWVLLGAVEEFQPHQHPEAYERICAGFSAGSWGMPSRVFRFVPERFERIAPVG